MINGTHVVFYSEKADADRDFLRDVLGFESVDAGHGWLIFALPPAEAAVHPVESGEKKPAPMSAEIYLMCDDLQGEIKRLQERKVQCSPVEIQRWGKKTTVRLPSGGEIGLYEPTHPTAIGLAKE